MSALGLRRRRASVPSLRRVRRDFERATSPPMASEWGSFGRSYVVPPVRVERPDLVDIGDGVVVLEDCWMSVVHAFPDVVPRLTLSDGVRVGRGCQFSVVGKVWIGPRVLISDFVQIGDTSHDYTSHERMPALFEPRPVVVEADAVILGHVVVLPGVTIGAGAVVDHRSVVMRDVAPHTRVRGNPAEPIGVAS